MTGNNPKVCPNCGAKDVEMIGSMLVCFQCRHSEHAEESRPFPQGLDPAKLPTYLAYSWDAFLREHHPRVQLHWLIDTAEIALRFVVSVTLAEVLNANGEQLPDSLLQNLENSHINVNMLSLAHWRRLLSMLNNVLPAKPYLFTTLCSVNEAIMDMYSSEGYKKATERTSFLELRNMVAHGGGIPDAKARDLVQAHAGRLEQLLYHVKGLMRGIDLVAVDRESAYRLVGIAPAPLQSIPKILVGKEPGPFLLSDSKVLPLLPLLVFGPVRQFRFLGLEVTIDRGIPQIYTKADTRMRRIYFTPLGCDEARSASDDLAAFERVFAPQASAAVTTSRPAPRKTTGGPQPESLVEGYFYDQFLRDATDHAQQLIGRRMEIVRVQEWVGRQLDAFDSGENVAWLQGRPGSGKTALMAYLAADCERAFPTHGVFFHRFIAGDKRNSRLSFLRLFKAALQHWTLLCEERLPPGEASQSEEQFLRRDLALLLKALRSANAGAGTPGKMICFVDGLDEIALTDKEMVSLIRELSCPGTVWVVSGRPAQGVEQMDCGEWAYSLFGTNGLPAMSHDEIRTMLIEESSDTRLKLLRMDEETPFGPTTNRFIDEVVKRAAGFPLYVSLLLKDVADGAVKVEGDGSNLPASLGHYYEVLLKRLELSDVGQLLTRVAGILCRSREPLEAGALAQLLSPDSKQHEKLLPPLLRALEAGRSLLEYTATEEGSYGYALYHHTLREYVGGDQTRGIIPALPGAVDEAEQMLYMKAAQWEQLDNANLRNHLFRHGTSYDLAWNKNGREEVVLRLTDFQYLQERVKALGNDGVTDLVREFRVVLEMLPPGPQRDAFKVWQAFFRSCEHLLRRGHEGWPAHKILLQLAVEHADESPVTQAAEKWLEVGYCNWMWLRSSSRPVRPYPSVCLATYQLLKGNLGGVVEIQPGLLLAWTKDGTVRVFDTEESWCDETNVAMLLPHMGVTAQMRRNWERTAGGSAIGSEEVSDTDFVHEVTAEGEDISLVVNVEDEDDFESEGSSLKLKVRYSGRRFELISQQISPLTMRQKRLPRNAPQEFSVRCAFLTKLPESFGKIVGLQKLQDGTYVTYSDSSVMQRWPATVFDVEPEPYFEMSGFDCVIDSNTVARFDPPAYQRSIPDLLGMEEEIDDIPC